MVYKKNFAAAIKANGKVLREQNGSVFLPFGQEYSITLKNLNSVRASVNISIDGKLISENGSLVVGPNKTIDVERFISNLNSGNRFKFIERTSTIENHRGIRVDDSLIRIEFSFEKKQKTYFQPSENVPFKDYYNHQPFYSSPVLHRSLSPGDITCQVAA